VDAPKEIIIEVMAGNGVIAIEMIDEVIFVESTRMEGGVKKTIAVQNDGGIKIEKALGKSGE
jgi:hypothetical protein